MSKFVITLSLILLASLGAAQKADVLTMGVNVGTKFTCGKNYIGGNPIVKVIGDVNGDLIGDIAVGFPYADATSASGSAPGLVAIIYGGANIPNGLDVCNFKDTSLGFRIKGPAASNFGLNIVSMGDLNGDGLQDIAVAAPLWNNVGRVYVIYTPAVNGRQQDYSIGALSTYTLTSATASAGFGTYMADPVDYNGDFVKDVLIASNANDASAYIFYGLAAKTGDTIVTNLSPLTGITLTQDPNTVDTGFARLPVISSKDINGDTVPDYILMGTNNIFILYGNGTRPVVEGVIVNNDHGEIISLGSPLTFSAAKSITTADLDMDGKQDIILSLSDNNVHVIYGSAIKGLAAVSGSSVIAKTYTQGFIITQANNPATFGQTIKRTDGWNGYNQDVLLISETTSSQVYAVYASPSTFNSSIGLTSFSVDNIQTPQQGFKVWTNDGSYKLGTSLDASYDVNGDGIKDLVVAEGISYNSYAVYGQCQSATGCACPNNLKYKNGQCVNWGLSGGQKVGIIIGVILGALLLIALGVLILKKTSCGSNCFESYAKPANFGSHTHAPIPQTMATSA